MTSSPNQRIRAAVLAGASAVGLLLTGACNDTAPPEQPGVQQDGGGEEQEEQEEGEDGGGGGY